MGEAVRKKPKKKSVTSKSSSSAPRAALIKRSKSKAKVKPKRNDAATVLALVEENREHGTRLAWSFLNKWRIRLDSDDVESVVGAALVEAAIRYDETKGAHFRTFFFYHLRGMLLKEVSTLIEQKKKLRHTPSEILENSQCLQGISESWPMKLVNSNTPEVLFRKQQESSRLWRICDLLDDLEREVIERHFIQDQSLKRIAEELSYCRCHISRVKSKALKTLAKVLPAVLENDTADLAKLLEDKRYTGGRGRRKKGLEEENTKIDYK